MMKNKIIRAEDIKISATLAPPIPISACFCPTPTGNLMLEDLLVLLSEALRNNLKINFRKKTFHLGMRLTFKTTVGLEVKDCKEMIQGFLLLSYQLSVAELDSK